MSVLVQMQVNKNLYIRDPEETDLGRRIISDGIKLIDKMGFDTFTFKKLADAIDSTEASVYRYFQSKQQLLQYLVSWYWHWLDYSIGYRTNNITDPHDQLEIAIGVLTESDRDDPATAHIDEALLHRIIISESARVFLTKQGKGVKAADVFAAYNLVSSRLTSIIKGVTPKYRYCDRLATTLIASVHQQMFHSEYSSTTAKTKNKKTDRKEIIKFLNHLIFSSIEKS